MTYEKEKKKVLHGQYADAGEKILESLDKQVPKKSIAGNRLEGSMMVKIEMEMPKSCADCPFEKDFECILDDDLFANGECDTMRNKHCPLIECEEERKDE